MPLAILIWKSVCFSVWGGIVMDFSVGVTVRPAGGVGRIL